MKATNVAIVSAARTPIGNLNGAFKDFSAIELGRETIEAAIQRANLSPDDVEEVVMGNVLQAGLGQNPARQAALAAGLPVSSSALTMNQVCGSGLSAISHAFNAIRCGDREVIVAGGMENMSQAPYLLLGARSGYRLGNQTILDSLMHDGLRCATNDYAMGLTAENVCERYGFTREQLDEFAYMSQLKTKEAVAAGKFNDEMVNIDVPQKKGKTLTVSADEYPRGETTVEVLSTLRPAFKRDGMVTAGNSSGINDGAAAMVLMSEEKASQLGLEPLAVIRAHATAGVDPAFMGTGPIPATEQVLKKSGLHFKDLELIECNEAFAAQALAFTQHFDVNPEIFNVNGGAIALGHPIGASGARILVTLLYEMQRRDARYGLATLCIGGGQGISLIVER